MNWLSILDQQPAWGAEVEVLFAGEISRAIFSPGDGGYFFTADTYGIPKRGPYQWRPL